VSDVAAVAASYSRYSSDLQDASSIAQQQRQCRERAQQNGHSIPPELEFADEAVSGTRRDRAGLNALLEAARLGRFGTVYFASLSRLARESVLTMPMLKELVYVHRVRVVSLSEGIDSAQSNWELLASFMSWVHERYLKELREAVLRGQQEAVLNDWSAGDWGLGYASEPVPGSERGRKGRQPKPRMRVVVNEEHAAWVRRIFRWFTQDRKSLGWIARELTRSGAPKDRRSSRPGWHHDYVRRALRNRKYIGVWPWGRSTNVRNPLTGQVAQEARPEEEAERWVRERPELRLIDDATFFRAQALLDESEARWSQARKSDGRLAGSRAGAAPASAPGAGEVRDLRRHVPGRGRPREVPGLLGLPQGPVRVQDAPAPRAGDAEAT
jgi:DNA invertase Pin-like site-specific DNA recombinase